MRPRRSYRSPMQQARPVPPFACSARSMRCPPENGRGCDPVQHVRRHLPIDARRHVRPRAARQHHARAGARRRRAAPDAAGRHTHRRRPRHRRRAEAGRAGGSRRTRLRAARRSSAWSTSPAPDLQHYTIYRAVDGKTFEPIGIQKAGVTSTRTSWARQGRRPRTGSPPSTRATTSRRLRHRSPPRLAR